MRTDVYDIEKISRGDYDIYKIYEKYEACMYLVCGSESACLIDTAYGLCDLKELTASLTSLPVFVVNTHGHIDHVLGNHYFDEVYMHPSDKEMYKEVADGFADMIGEPWVREKYGEFIKDADPSSVRFPKTMDVRDGNIIDLGGKILEVVGIPGHTPGSIMLIDREEKICFSGDSIIEHLWLFLEESLSPSEYRDNLARAVGKLRDAGVERIYNGHYAYKPLTMADCDAILSGMEKVCAGTAEGRPFSNDAGSGTEYVFGEFSALCGNENNLPEM